MIPAHDSPLAALAFSPTGLRLATASEKGTVIRVFSVTDGVKLFEFRRGVKRCVSISSLVFSMDSAFVCCSSNTETVIIFFISYLFIYLKKIKSKNTKKTKTILVDNFSDDFAIILIYIKK